MNRTEPRPAGRPGSHGKGYLTDQDPAGEVALVADRWNEYAIGHQLSKHGRLRVTAALTRRGCSAREIALALGTAERTVVRYRREIRSAQEKVRPLLREMA